MNFIQTLTYKIENFDFKKIKIILAHQKLILLLYLKNLQL
jgi:hypothetical protein